MLICFELILFEMKFGSRFWISVICAGSLVSSLQGQSLNDSLRIMFQDGSEVPEVVREISSRNITLVCGSNETTIKSVEWKRQEDENFSVMGSSLVLNAVTVHDAGTYMCEATSTDDEVAVKEFALDVLYRPTRPVIEGPANSVTGRHIVLKCSVTSNPPASYHWTFSEDPEATVEATGEEFSFYRYDPEELNVYCWVTATLVPSRGNRVQSQEMNEIMINIQEKTHVAPLPSEAHYVVGETIHITCVGDGVPEPEIYWSKDDDDEFRQSGHILYIANAQRADTGVYTCHSENRLVITDQSEIIAQDTEELLVVVGEWLMSENCSAYLESMTKSCNDDGPEMEAEITCSRTALVAVAAAGWIIALMMTMVGIAFIIRFRDLKREQMALYAEKRRMDFQSKPVLSDVSLVPILKKKKSLAEPTVPYNISNEIPKRPSVELKRIKVKESALDIAYCYEQEVNVEIVEKKDPKHRKDSEDNGIGY